MGIRLGHGEVLRQPPTCSFSATCRGDALAPLTPVLLEPTAFARYERKLAIAMVNPQGQEYRHHRWLWRGQEQPDPIDRQRSH